MLINFWLTLNVCTVTYVIPEPYEHTLPSPCRESEQMSRRSKSAKVNTTQELDFIQKEKFCILDQSNTFLFKWAATGWCILSEFFGSLYELLSKLK